MIYIYVSFLWPLSFLKIAPKHNSSPALSLIMKNAKEKTWDEAWGKTIKYSINKGVT